MLIKIKNVLKTTPVLWNKRLLFITIIDSLLISIVLYLQICDSPYYAWILPLFCIIQIVTASFFCERIKKMQINYIINHNKNEKAVVIFVLCFVIVFAGQLLYWFAYYPGGFNLDALGQWDQIHGRQPLNNWHPVLTTFFYWFLTRFNDSFEFCILVQLILFAFTISYFLKELFKNGVSESFVFISSIIIAVNPAVGMNNICLIKDVPFTIVTIWAFFVTYKLYLSAGECITHISNRIAFVIILSSLSLIRHNAVFLTIPLVVITFIVYKQYYKYFLRVIISSLLVLIFTETVIFSLLKVQQHSNFTGEISGIPMAIMANAYVNDYENTPEEVKLFLEEIAPYSEWEDRYIVGEWDSCKWEFGGIELLKKESILKILRMCGETIISCPQSSYASLRENTRLVWQVVGRSYWRPWVYIEENESGIGRENSIYEFEYLVEYSENNVLMSTLLWNIGLIIIILLILNWVSFVKKKYKSILFIGPIIIYNFCTMCLLSGPSFRYFYFNSVMIFPILGIFWGLLNNRNN